MPKQVDIERHPEKSFRVNRKYNISVAKVDALKYQKAVTEEIKKQTQEMHLE